MPEATGEERLQRVDRRIQTEPKRAIKDVKSP
jgi:hypothetical protein